MTEQKKTSAEVPPDTLLELCDQIRQRRPYPWRWISLGGCYVCSKLGRICLNDPVGCKMVNERYERSK